MTDKPLQPRKLRTKPGFEDLFVRDEETIPVREPRHVSDTGSEFDPNTVVSLAPGNHSETS